MKQPPTQMFLTRPQGFRWHFVLTGAILAAFLLGASWASTSPASAASFGPCKESRYSMGGKLRKITKTCFSQPRISGEGFVVGYQDSIYNGLKNQISGSCVAEKSKTVTQSFSATVGVEGSAWIFAKASASVSGGIAKSMSSGYKTTTTFKVPARKTVTCTRGVVTKKFSTLRTVTTRNYIYSGRNSVRVFPSTSYLSVRGEGPNKAQWRVK